MTTSESNSTAANALVAVTLTIFLPASVLGFINFMRHRYVFPITGRSVPLLVVFWVPLTIAGVYYPLSSLLETTDCVLLLVFGLHMELISVNALHWRAFRLWFLYFMSQERVERHNRDQLASVDLAISPSNGTPVLSLEDGKDDGISYEASKSIYEYNDPRDEGWFVRHRHWVSTKFLIGTLCAVTVVEYIIVDLVFAFGPPSFETVFEKECPSLGVVILLCQSYETMACITFAVTCWRISGIQDNYKIKRELLLDTGAGALLVTNGLLHRVLDYPYIPILDCLISLFILGVYVPMFFYPVHLAKIHVRSSDRLSRSSNAGGASTTIGVGIGNGVEEEGHTELTTSAPTHKHKLPRDLEELLTNDAHVKTREAFVSYLSREFSVENVMFWYAVRHYESQWETHSDRGMARRARALYERFVRVGAPDEVNIIGSIRNKITRLVSDIQASDHDRELGASKPPRRPAKDMFTHAAQTVLTLMQRDSYMRFRRQSRQNWKHTGEVFLASTPKAKIELG